MGDEKSPLGELRENIVAAAASAVIEAMTPAQMRKVSEQVIEHTLAGISTDRYSNLGRLVEVKAEEVLKEYLGTDDVKAQLRVAVREGVDAAMVQVPEEIKGKIMDMAMKAMVQALPRR